MLKLFQFNPLKDRIFKVFSSHKDGKFSFEDMLDLCSVMSNKCPDKVKAAWAFRIYGKKYILYIHIPTVYYSYISVYSF